MWVKQVARITPPPKQDMADTTNFPRRLDVVCPITLHFFSNNGSNPKNREIPPNKIMETIFAEVASIFILALL